MITQAVAQPGSVPVVAGGTKPSYFHSVANRNGPVITVSASGANAGYVSYWDQPIFASDCSTIETADARSELRFIFHALRASQTRIDALRAGAAQPHVYAKDLEEFRIPWFDVGEQRRIAAILDQAEALRGQRRSGLALLSLLRQSVYEAVFDSDTSAWPTMKLGDISDVQGGLQISAARRVHPVEVPYLRVANVFRGFVELSEVKTLRATEAEVRRTSLLKNDLLVVEGHGNPNEIGRVAVWSAELRTCVHQNHIIRVRLDPTRAVAEYVSAYLNSKLGRQHLLRSGKTTSGLNTISVSNVRDTPVVLPPLGEQERFERRLREIARLETLARTALAEVAALFASLQHRAFSGQL